MKICIEGKTRTIDPRSALGKGGEAEVFDIGSGQALKLYKNPDHPDYKDLPLEQAAAKRRIDAAQDKLMKFPRGVHARIVEPLQLATDTAGRVAGYTMRLIDGAEPLFRYGERAFRNASGIRNAAVTGLFRELRETVSALHRARVTIGDFNDLNVLIRYGSGGAEAWLIDADSFQFGRYLCPMFTARFVDPLRCDPARQAPLLVRAHNEASDWYAFAALLLQSLLFVHPYGGVYRPKDLSQRIPPDARTMQRITVFHPEVVYPKPALHFSMLPDDALDYFQRVFEKDERGEFPVRVLDAMEWSVCPNCGAEHARRNCPNCAHTAPAAIKSVTRVRGKVVSTRVFATAGEIVFVTLDPRDNRLKWIVHESGTFKREDGATVLNGKLDAKVRFRIAGTSTLVGRNRQFVTIHADGRMERSNADEFKQTPEFDANGRRRFWLHGGQLLADGAQGPEFIGNVLAGQTRFWAGPRFGFGCYRAGGIATAFVFGAQRRGINDRVKLPALRGEVLDMACVFGGQRAWFFTISNENGRRIHRCAALASDGSMLAQSEAQEGASAWLEQIHGHGAVGDFLFAPTDEGIVRLSTDGGQIKVDREYPDTEPFVDSSRRLFVSSSGIFVASRREIHLLTIG